jgi:hypothetical protein
LHTLVWNFLEFAKEFSWKILKFSSKMVKNVFKSVWVEPRELKFWMLMFCEVEYKIAYSRLEFFGTRLGTKYRAEILHEHALLVLVWNCIFKFRVLEIRLSGFLKNPDIFLKKCQKCVQESFQSFLLFKIAWSSLWIFLRKKC